MAHRCWLPLWGTAMEYRGDRFKILSAEIPALIKVVFVRPTLCWNSTTRRASSSARKSDFVQSVSVLHSYQFICGLYSSPFDC